MGTKGIIETPSSYPTKVGSAAPSSGSTSPNPPHAKATTSQPRKQVVTDNRHAK